MFKDDTTRASVEIRKLYPGYELIAYWKSMGLKKVTHYSSHYTIISTYFEYFENGNVKVDGNYLNGKPDGKWKFYNDKGDQTSTEIYEHGALVPNSR